MRAYVSLSALVLTLSAPLLCSSRAAPPQASNPNVLLIVLDDLGPENLSFWPATNAPAVTTAYTPTLASLAQSGIMFTHCHSQPVCSPTRACIQTGLYAFRTGMGTNPTPADSLDPNTTTIGDVLHASSSYAAGLFGKWHLGDLNNYDHPIECGYDLFDGVQQNDFTSVPNGDHFVWEEIVAQPGLTLPPIQHGATFTEADYTVSVIGTAARAWIDSMNQQSKPWFACVNFNVPHTPHQIPPYTMIRPATATALSAHVGWGPGFSATGQQLPHADLIQIFDAAIQAVDTQIGRLTIGLSNTTIIVVGDNGTGITAVQSPYRASHAKDSVYSGGTRVPMIVSGASVSPSNAGTTCARPVSVVDMLPTVAALAGATVTTTIDGASFVPLINNPAGAATRPWALTQIFDPHGIYVPHNLPPATFTRHDRGICDGQFHYVRILRGTTYIEELYDLSVDALETNDLFTCYSTLNCMQGQGYTSAQVAQIQSMIAAMSTVSEP